jgi:hypothetical protein
MNERIKQLAEQCWNKRPEDQLHFDNEKFAELIIRECADIATMKQHEWHSAGSYILEHFGVVR